MCNENQQSSISLGYNRKDSPWKYDTKVYVDGKKIVTLDDAREEATMQLALLIAREG